MQQLFFVFIVDSLLNIYFLYGICFFVMINNLILSLSSGLNLKEDAMFLGLNLQLYFSYVINN